MPVPALLPPLLGSWLSPRLSPRSRARHAAPSPVAPLVAAGGLTAALVVADATVASTAASAGGSWAQFERLAACESGGRWGINTGNGYYGGLQFGLATWRGLGLGGYPHQASKAQQIAAGQKLHSSRGWQPWPACSRKLGLSGNGGYGGSGEAPPARAPAASRSRPATPAPPPFDGRELSTRDVRTFRPAVRLWQARMAARGWAIRADGHFGPRSAGVAAAFAREKGLPTRAPGVVGKAVWDAAWTSPVT